MRLPEPPPRKEMENLLPLVNVVFLLLIFFMVAGAFSTPEAFMIDPTIAINEADADPKSLTILMNKQGELAIDTKTVSLDELLIRIQDQSQTLTKVQLKPDAGADALHVVELLEHLSATEVELIHVVTRAP